MSYRRSTDSTAVSVFTFSEIYRFLLEFWGFIMSQRGWRWSEGGGNRNGERERRGSPDSRELFTSFLTFLKCLTSSHTSFVSLCSAWIFPVKHLLISTARQQHASLFGLYRINRKGWTSRQFQDKLGSPLLQSRGQQCFIILFV